MSSNYPWWYSVSSWLLSHFFFFFSFASWLLSLLTRKSLLHPRTTSLRKVEGLLFFPQTTEKYRITEQQPREALEPKRPTGSQWVMSSRWPTGVLTPTCSQATRHPGLRRSVLPQWDCTRELTEPSHPPEKNSKSLAKTQDGWVTQKGKTAPKTDGGVVKSQHLHMMTPGFSVAQS